MVTRKSAGKRLVEHLSMPGDGEDLTALITEAGRVKDRLDVLHKLTTGQQTLWMRLRGGKDGDLFVTVDQPLAEARQQAATLRQLIAAVHRQRAGLGPVGGEDDLAGLG